MSHAKTTIMKAMRDIRNGGEHSTQPWVRLRDVVSRQSKYLTARAAHCQQMVGVADGLDAACPTSARGTDEYARIGCLES